MEWMRAEHPEDVGEKFTYATWSIYYRDWRSATREGLTETDT